METITKLFLDIVDAIEMERCTLLITPQKSSWTAIVTDHEGNVMTAAGSTPQKAIIALYYPELEKL
jgi:hypothetical protein